MSEAAAAPAETNAPPSQPSDAQPADKAAAAVTPPKPDPKSEVNEKLKGLGLKLKAKDREVPVSSLDDLVSRAQRVFGVESMLEEAKSAKSEAEQVKAWRAAMEADDPQAAQDAFEALSPKAQANALKWIQRKAAAAQEEEQMSEREREMRRLLDEQDKRLRDFQRKDEEARRAKEEAETRAEFERTREMAAELAHKALESLKAPKELAPSLLPRVARVLRVGLEAGVQLSPDEVANEVRESLVGEHQHLVSGLDGEGLINLWGEETAKKVVKAFLARRKAAPPSQQQVAAVNGETRQPARQQDDAPLRGTPRFFR